MLMLDETGINKHDVSMPILNGPRVRHLAARRGLDVVQLAQRCGIHKRTLQNATRDRKPQGLSLPRVYKIASELVDEPDNNCAVEALVSELLDRNDGVPSEPPKQPKPPPAPPRRQKDAKAPRRVQAGSSA